MKIILGYQTWVKEDWKRDKEQWKQKCVIWEHEKKLAVKEKRQVNLDLDPGEEPFLRALMIPSAVSKAMMTKMMKANEKFGSFIMSSEGDSLNDSNSKDYGQMMDVFNKALVNEPVDRGFLVDGESFAVAFTILVILVTGTDNQIRRLISSYETGFGSRVPVYMTKTADQYYNQKPNDDGVDYKEYYEDLGNEALRMWKFFREFSLEVRFTDEQWDRHTEQWGGEFDELKIGKPDMLSVGLRYGMHHLRFASVLTMLRLWDRVKEDEAAVRKELSVGEVHRVMCSDEDYELSVRIASTLFEHTIMFATTVVERRTPSRPMKQWRWQYVALDAMPEEFTQIDFVEYATKEFNKSVQTCRRVVKEMATGRYKVLKELKTKVDGKKVYKKIQVNQ